MFILQRWEPIASETFPSEIPFWITIQHNSLLLVTEKTIHALGSKLGRVEEIDLDQERM